jgi:hypothetical protein
MAMSEDSKALNEVVAQTEHSAPATPPAFFALPFSGEKVPAALAEVNLRITGEMPTHDGIAFGAEVRRNGKIIGTIENQGTGGGTWFHHHDVEVMNWWHEREQEMKRILVEVEGDTEFMAEEIMCDRLFEDVALYKELNRKRSLLLRFNENVNDIRIFRGGWDSDVKLWVADEKRKTGATVDRWIKNTGWERV